MKFSFLNVQRMLQEMAKPGLFLEGTPHSRAQNYLAHVAIAMVLAKMLTAVAINPICAAIVVSSLGFIWEARGVWCANADDRCMAGRKSAVDISAFALGAFIATGTDSLVLLILGFLAFLLSAAYGAVSSVSGCQASDVSSIKGPSDVI